MGPNVGGGCAVDTDSKINERGLGSMPKLPVSHLCAASVAIWRPRREGLRPLPRGRDLRVQARESVFTQTRTGAYALTKTLHVGRQKRGGWCGTDATHV